MNNTVSKIECDLLPMKDLLLSSKKIKYGRYHGSCFWDIKGYGSKKWVVGVKIKLDFDSDGVKELTNETIIEACMNHLNTVPPRKKYAKKKPTPKYGFLECYKAQIREKGGDKYISALLITDKNKSKFFWGKGKNA